MTGLFFGWGVLAKSVSVQSFWELKKELVQEILGTTEITEENVWKFPKPDEFKVSEEMCLRLSLHSYTVVIINKIS